MQAETGAIAYFETKKDALIAGYKINLTQEELEILKPMGRKQRRQWVRDKRKLKTATGGSR